MEFTCWARLDRFVCRLQCGVKLLNSSRLKIPMPKRHTNTFTLKRVRISCVCLVVACVAIITQVKMFAHFSGNDAETKVDSLHKPAYKRITGSFRCIWMYTGYILWMTAYHDTVLTHTHTHAARCAFATVTVSTSHSRKLGAPKSVPKKTAHRTVLHNCNHVKHAFRMTMRKQS